ncbi:MAG TPA: hypothetical protein DCE77_11495 [Methylophaga sp.]|uniref:hypothetical protein n=1 Tax=unclassified Methylophaga TaxID=2629249 RepID=UPI000C97807F|nr:MULTISPECIES: hypothetical protein [unclassified Methylophaga]MAP27744.1 hypothetical protein [Methylophaga sp.]HAD32190.1 hypothetical protein [Methylophaga sp.]HBX59863.1 hypothetical protein [Methylophaga sp.]
MKTVTESIFSGKTHIIPMAEVHHIERDMREDYSDAVIVVLNGTTWNVGMDAYNNSAYLRHEEASAFLSCWCRYRAELECESLADLSPDEIIPGTLKALHELGRGDS